MRDRSVDDAMDLPGELDALVALLRRPEDLGPGVTGAVMQAVRGAPAPLRVVVGGAAPTPAWARARVEAVQRAERRGGGRLARAWRWVAEPRPIRVSPIGALAAAGLAFAAVFGLRKDTRRPAEDERLANGQTGEFPAFTGEYAAVKSTAEHPTPTAAGVDADGATHRFMIVAPTAREVSVVGDFNDWDQGATPLVRVTSQGVWTVEVPLEPGRYSYAFLVDGKRWLPDPGAPRAVGDDFGRPSSVVTVRGGRA